MSLFGNIRAWRNQIPNALIGGRVEAHAGAAAPGVLAVVKSVQRGYSAITLIANGTSTVAIPNAITPSKSVLVQEWGRHSGVGNLVASITGSTTITITNLSSTILTWRVEWQVVEFE